jgi:hypothetical protein
MFTIDGREFDGVMSLERAFTVDEDGNGGKALDGTVLRSVTGTRYDYTLVIDSDGMDRADYDLLYELLSAPAPSHLVTVPYGAAGSRSFTAYVTGGEDRLERIDADGRVWGSLKVGFYALSPQRAAL